MSKEKKLANNTDIFLLLEKRGFKRTEDNRYRYTTKNCKWVITLTDNKLILFDNYVGESYFCGIIKNAEEVKFVLDRCYKPFK